MLTWFVNSTEWVEGSSAIMSALTWQLYSFPPPISPPPHYAVIHMLNVERLPCYFALTTTLIVHVCNMETSILTQPESALESSFSSAFSLQKELQNLEDASDELMLADDTLRVPYPFIP